MGIFSVFSMGEFSDKMKIENCWKTVIVGELLREMF